MLNTRVIKWFLFALLALPAFASAVDLRFIEIAPGVHVFIGEMSGRSYENEGMNANVGFVVTKDGVVVVDSGPSYRVAKKIHEAIRRVTRQPVKYVINTGGQDHRWLGNGYFLAQGAEVLAHAAGQADMANRGGEQLAALRQVMGAKADGTVPAFPSRWLQGADVSLTLGGVAFEFKHRGGAHTPGDLLVWLPQQRVLFTGDVVYVERMLGVLPVSNTRAWMASFEEVERLAPLRIVPGHGRVTDLAQARADTRDYLAALRAHMKRAVDEGQDIGSAIKAFDTRPYQRLHNSAELLPGNASRTYLEIERE